MAKGERLFIAAQQIIADYHAVVINDEAHLVDEAYPKRNMIVIRTESNVTLMRNPKDKVLVEIIGDEPTPTSTSTAPVWTRRFPRPA